MTPAVTSPHNPRVQALRALRLRRTREREHRFLVEGIRLVEEALDTGAPVETLVYSPELLASERALALVAEFDAARRLELSAGAFRSLSERDDPQGLAAAVRIEERSLHAIPLPEDALIVVACQLRDPGNLGTLIRTADAAGASGVVVVEPSVDLYDPETVRATMGSLFSLPLARVPGESDLLAWFASVKAAGVPLLVVASSPSGAQLHFDVDYRGPVALLVGNERVGLSTVLLESADSAVRLPMLGSADSLNAAAAAAALLYEIVRQRLSSTK